ncbi:MAG TPA: L-seryl-tRNA(Sec) selenium transferase [Clostridia bacterium]|nr:L-seryl-tRNA(Sec) selenium transferase [Clostridia bacterium]
MGESTDLHGQKSSARAIPSVTELLKNREIEKILGQLPRRLVVDAIREALEQYRSVLLNPPHSASKRVSDTAAAIRDAVVEQVKESLRRFQTPSIHPVINATGIPLHTNLGRAPLSDQAAAAMYEAARNYVNLELDLKTGTRGSRQVHLSELLRKLTGAEDALVVNNNAAAVLLCLNTLADGREVIVSRGELVEIGGSFRLPDIMKKSGATLVEVGTTNRTYVRDYADAITDRTALILRVHPSNYAQKGYIHRVSLRELAELARERGVTLLNDAGSGALFRTEEHGLPTEPFIPDEVSAGSDLVTFSGDKLLGGPQAGIILGRRDLILEMKRNPLYRAVRVDKVIIAGLEATLRAYLLCCEGTPQGSPSPPSRHEAPLGIPIVRMLLENPADVRSRAEVLAATLADVVEGWFTVSVEDSTTEVGGGSLPLAEIPTSVVRLSPRTDRPAPVSVNRFSSLLRNATPPIIGRILQESVILDAKTIREDQIPITIETIKSILAKEPFAF